MNCRTEGILIFTAENEEYRNVLQIRQHIGNYCKTGSVSENTAE